MLVVLHVVLHVVVHGVVFVVVLVVVVAVVVVVVDSSRSDVRGKTCSLRTIYRCSWRERNLAT